MDNAQWYNERYINGLETLESIRQRIEYNKPFVANMLNEAQKDSNIHKDIVDLLTELSAGNKPSILTRIGQWLGNIGNQAYNYTRQSIRGILDGLGRLPFIVKFVLIAVMLSNPVLLVSTLAIVTLGQYLTVLIILLIFNTVHSLIEATL